MSVVAQIDRIKSNIASAYSKAEEKGAELPPVQNSENLPAVIESIPTGGGFAVPLVVTADVGTVLTAANGDATVTGTVDDSGSVTLTLPAPGDWSVTARLGDKTKGPEIVSVKGGYTFEFHMASRLPEGYTELEYIEATQTSPEYINIPIKGSITLAVELDIEILSLIAAGSSIAVFFGSLYSSNSSVYNYFRAYQTSSAIGIGYGTKAYLMKNPPTVGRHKICLDANGLQAKYDDETVAMDKMYQSNLPNSSSIPLFCGRIGSSLNNYANIRMYSCRISDKGALVWDGVPCTAPSGRTGLYDLVSGTFFPNQYAKDFTPGPAV